uniref:EGF-like domain-containing protein n=1 Tax=Setaria digitata TaxID=48799 RepID=A0A915PG57_9BILA
MEDRTPLQISFKHKLIREAQVKKRLISGTKSKSNKYLTSDVEEKNIQSMIELGIKSRDNKSNTSIAGETSDPCSTNPCKNGATCIAKDGKHKIMYECFCPLGFGGVHCESRPCDVNPCLNNGTCRTTSSYSTFFCDCLPKFGGKFCDIVIGETKSPQYSKNMELISSGKVEWIEKLKEIKTKELQSKKAFQQNQKTSNETKEGLNEQKDEEKASDKLDESDKEKNISDDRENLINTTIIEMLPVDIKNLIATNLIDTPAGIATDSSCKGSLSLALLSFMLCLPHSYRN